MRLGAILGSSTAAVGATAGAVVTMAAGVMTYMIMSSDASDPAPQPAPVEDSQPVDAADPTPVAETPAYDPPSFEQVRVAPDGNTVIAGRAPGGAQVILRLDGAEIADVAATGAGSFAALFEIAPSDTPRVLSLLARIDGEEIAGDDQVIIAPFAGPAPEPGHDIAEAPVEDPVPPAAEVAEAAEPTTQPPGDTPTAATEPPDEPASAEMAAAPAGDPPAQDPGPVAEAPAAPAAPSVIIAGPQGIRVTQATGRAPEVQTEVRLDAISYDTAGEVTLSGRGPAEARVQVFLNNEPIQMGEIGAGGDWSLDLPDVDPGTYTLRVAELSPEGDVTSQVETPFLREDPERVAAAPMLVDQGVSVITVQPGFTLWGIAEANFGDGVAYVQIFEENRDQIRDPNWIFPGQIFQLPDLPRVDDAPGQ